MPQSSRFPKPNKVHNTGTNYRPISLLSPIVKTLEETLLPYITENNPFISHQHGFKHKHSTHTALHNICHQIARGFNNPRPPQRIVAVALDMSKALIVNIHKLIHKLTLTNIPKIINEFITNYIKGQQACIQYDSISDNLHIITDKTTTTLSTPDPTEYSTTHHLN